MRDLYVILATAVILLTTGDVVSASTSADWIKPKKLSSDDVNGSGQRFLRSYGMADADAGSIHEDRDGLFSLPEELEELVESHHHVREIFTRWCLEDKDPKEAEKEAKSGKEAQVAKLYKLYMTNAAADDDRRKLTGLECNLLTKKDT
ncbi:hypothetical protein PF005_g1487 [Phytophthora fragariae]|uniref:RxLR effector protein n=1 Tax=Phytophthora fragariae TaxID=53985 RepID=A0A6A3TM28_9STRA|nr:hypothetical protein PF009_g1182 [Phytophthora fragariae]KAE9029796.1 hypothetical protein PF011_g915 [Phytophthora fragariae]KAE9137767.1 hypothetical protein PF010_g1204 [Phytophthora fragariae]KAE9138297.1 hypothetical protein PF007_g1485 [Phytophthora fragariae]KAE9154776.1 hypothetical protein PF006_g1227 [Phytophthora fragariae]